MAQICVDEHFSVSVINEQQKTIHGRTVEDEMVERIEELKEQPIISIESTSAILINRQDVLFSADQQSEMDQRVINYIREDLDQNLNNEINSHDNSSMAYNIDHCKNSSNDIATISSGECYRYAPARNRYNDRIPYSMKSDTIVHVTGPVKIRHWQQQHFLNKTSKEYGNANRRRYSKEEDNSSKHDGYEKSLDDDSTSGLFVGPICYCNNSVPVELENLGINLQPELLIVEIPMQNIRNYNLSASDDPNLQQICITTSRIHDRRRIGRGSQRRCYYSKQDFRCGSRDIQHPSYTTRTESDDEGSLSPTNFRNTIRSRQKISDLSREQESVDPSCMPPIVTAIDSGRESDIIRKNSPRRTSSRNKKIRNRGFNVEIRAQSDDESFADRRRTLSASSSSYDKPIDAYLVTEF